MAIVLLVTACNGNTETPSTPFGSSALTPTSSPAVSATTDAYQIDPDSTAAPPAAADGPATYGELLDAGIAAGRWDELHGLDLVLGYALGEVPRDQVPGVDSVQVGEVTDLLERVDSLAASGRYSEDQLTELRHSYELIAPEPNVIDQIAGSARKAIRHPAVDAVLAAAFQPGKSDASVAAAADCAPVDPSDFSRWGDYEDCYLMYEDSVEGITVRVLYPSWFDDDATVAELPLRAREAIVRSAATYSPLGPVPDMEVIFSMVNVPPSERPLLAHTTFKKQSGSCPITIFPRATTSTNPLETSIAHEAWHCVQHEEGYRVRHGTDWYLEGGAVYFANVVYPADNGGWAWFFDKRSTTTSLFDMSYEAFVWWQFLGSRDSPKAVADLQLQMAQAGDGGHAAMKGYGPIFHRFVVELVAGKIPTPTGGTFRPAKYESEPLESVTKDDKGKDIRVDADAFVATRLSVEYERQLRVLESDKTDPDVDVGMVELVNRTEPSAWKEVFPEVRSKCKTKVKYVVVATTEDTKQAASTPIHVDDIQEAVCDPCLLGTWDLDLNSFKSMLTRAMAGQGGELPAGVDFDLSGHYYISFDDEGVLKEQRDALTITSSFAGFSMNTVIDGFAHGTYTADGENMSISDLTDDYVRVSTGDRTYAEGSQILSGSGTYECRTDDMTLTIDSYQPLDWTRVDKILEPPSDISVLTSAV